MGEVNARAHRVEGESSRRLGRCFHRRKGNPVSQGQEFSKAKGPAYVMGSQVQYRLKNMACRTP